MKFRFLMAVALAGVLTAAACGGDDDDDSNGDSGNGSGTPTQSTGEGTPSGSATQPSGGNDELFADSSDKTYLVTYDTEFDNDGTMEKGTITFAQKPPKSVTRMSFESEGEMSDIVFIDDGTNSFSCFGSGDEGQCLKSTSSGVVDSFALFDMKQLTDRVKEDKDIKEVSGQKIAGRDSRCFEGTLPSDEGEEESGLFCVDKNDGIITFIETETTKLRATEISGKVDDKEFEPPYAIVG